MRVAFLFVLAVVLFAACSGEESSSTTACTPGATELCICSTGAQASRTCLPDGSGYGECDGPDCTCPAATSNACCMSDAQHCCSCVPNDCSYAKRQPFLECACQEGVCAAECDVECAGAGFSVDLTCQTCVEMAIQGTCKAQYDACK